MKNNPAMGQKRRKLTAILRKRQLLQATATILRLRFGAGAGSPSQDDNGGGGDGGEGGALIAGRSGRYDKAGGMVVEE